MLPLWRGPFSNERAHTVLRTSPMGDAALFSSTADAFATAPQHELPSSALVGEQRRLLEACLDMPVDVRGPLRARACSASLGGG